MGGRRYTTSKQVLMGRVQEIVREAMGEELLSLDALTEIDLQLLADTLDCCLLGFGRGEGAKKKELVLKRLKKRLDI